MPQISVIVLTYNPDETKLRQTLSAIAAQEGISFELIIGDDGSPRKDFAFLPDFLRGLEIESYQLLDHKENRGTVQNCIAAIQAATGKYVFLTSPGDLLFDPFVLRDFYQFAENNNAQLCFGNAVFYAKSGQRPVLTRTVGNPAQPKLYAPEKNLRTVNTAFFGGSWIIGASYFRTRDLALKTLTQIADTSKYVEDTTSTVAALVEGHRIYYYDRNIVWYEDGTGVSTSGNNKWDQILRQDIQQSFAKAKKQHPKNPYVDVAYRNIMENNRLRRILGNLLRHPIIMTRLMYLRKTEHSPIHCSSNDIERLAQMLNNA